MRRRKEETTAWPEHNDTFNDVVKDIVDGRPPFTTRERILWALHPAWPPPTLPALVYLNPDDQGFASPFGSFTDLRVRGRFVSRGFTKEHMEIAGEIIRGELA